MTSCTHRINDSSNYEALCPEARLSSSICMRNASGASQFYVWWVLRYQFCQRSLQDMVRRARLSSKKLTHFRFSFVLRRKNSGVVFPPFMRFGAQLVPNTLQASALPEIIYGSWKAGITDRRVSARSMADCTEHTSDNRLTVRRGSERTPCFHGPVCCQF
ncbi:hypothetical protein BDV11DRAFT_114615 [Aspergillus similis]